MAPENRKRRNIYTNHEKTRVATVGFSWVYIENTWLNAFPKLLRFGGWIRLPWIFIDSLVAGTVAGKVPVATSLRIA